VQPAQGQRQRGIAVLVVIACLAVLAPFTATFNYQARVDWQSAVNLRDEVAARSIQRGAMRLSLLLFEVQQRVFNNQQFREMLGTMDITQVAPYLMSVFSTPDGASGLGMLVGVDTSALRNLSIQNGNFEVRLTAESGKVNVNCLADQSAGGGAPAGKDGKTSQAKRVVETLEALMMPVLYNPLFEEEKTDGQRYTRQDVVRALADYIDSDTKRFDIVTFTPGSAGERYRYMELFDAYTARDSRMDSIEEINLVEGIDDDWMSAFGHELTVYGSCKVNLNFASPEQIALVIRHAVASEDKFKTEGDLFLTKTLPLAKYVVEYRQFSLFKSIDDFRDFVDKPDQFLNPMMLMMQGGVGQRSNLPRIPEGIKIRSKAGAKDGATWNGIEDVATVAPERVYRVEIITTVGAVRKRLTTVYDVAYPRSQTSGKGAWLYYRED
jgi:type II secretory pathway component PulK